MNIQTTTFHDTPPTVRVVNGKVFLTFGDAVYLFLSQAEAVALVAQVSAVLTNLSTVQQVSS